MEFRIYMLGRSKQSPDEQNLLSCLPFKRAVEYRRNQIIYDAKHPSEGLWFIVKGRVKITTTIEPELQGVIGILGANDFFGEGGLLGQHITPTEEATALENSHLLLWTAAEVEARILLQPRFGLALVQKLVQRCVGFQERLESLAWGTSKLRIGTAFLAFAKAGTYQQDGTIRIPPLTHQLLAGYVASGREMVTAQLNEWRNRGLLRYSRKGIEIYPQALAEELRNAKRHGRGER